MWRRGGRSSALDRAQALLSAKRPGRVGADESATKTWSRADDVDGFVTTRAVPPTQTLLSDLSDLSSASSAPDPEAAPGSSATAWSTQDTGREPTRDLRPQSSLGGGGSRFLKKAPPPATNSSQEPNPRYVSSSQRGFQNAALNRLAQIESRFRSRKQAQEQTRQGSENTTSDLRISPPPAARSLEAPVQLSAQSSSDQSLSGKRFLKNTTRGRDTEVRSTSRAADVVFPSASLDKKSGGVVSGVSLESDEEDMKKLLGDSLDSMDSSFLKPRRPSSARTTDKMLIKSSPKVQSTPPPKPAPTHSPTSPTHRSSPFRFTGQAQSHFSPFALSPSPSPPHISPSPPRRLNYSHRTESPPRSLSSMSGCSQVMSLEELFPARCNAEDLQSDMSEVFSEDFKINVMTLDDLVPANPGFTEEAPHKEKQAKHSSPQQLPRLKEEEKGEQQQEEEEDMQDYQSDFESESRTEPDHSASQVSEHLQAHGDEEEIVSEIMEKTTDSDVSHGRTGDDYSSTFSDTSRSYTSPTANQSQTFNRGTDSRAPTSSVSHASRSRRRPYTETVLKDSAVQTQPDSLAPGMSTLGPTVGTAYTYPSPVVAHTLSADMVEALCTFNPAAFALNEVLKQQLALTRRFIERNRDLHFSLMKSLEPPNYRYTTLEDTMELFHSIFANRDLPS
ncbi:uncharacterized protein C19orf44 homolog isoform X2 [Notolabrus celidotus]|uniref:uncharacterized protein C19orf44 homolog isoform X2 n=1 Tax=Notolabrus celidotus TaxID=1203425 RepID=UPI0014907568|nr:uncharacterized protein C19orf44 homolog isoform X2 [Notolabrus celidotus]